jgi:hypothetical protein
MKLAAPALGVCVIALLLLAPMLVPEAEPPRAVDQVSLQPSVDSGAPAPDAATRHRPRRRSRPGDDRPRAIQRGRSSKASQDARSISRRVRGGGNAVGGGRDDARPPGGPPAADPPTPRWRDDPAEGRLGAPPTPRSTPAPGNPRPQGDSGSQAGPTPVSAAPADAPDPPDQPDPLEEDATAAAADPLDEADEPEIAADGAEDETP